METLRQTEPPREQGALEIARFIDMVNIPLFGVNLAGAVNEWNQSISRLTGYAREEILGKDFAVTMLAEESRTEFRTRLKRTFEGAENNLMQVPLCHRNGAKIIVLFSYTLRHGASGLRVGAIGTGLVITELIQKYEALESQLEDSISERDNAYAELSHIAGIQRQFLTDMNHRLFTPMNSLFGFIDLLRGQYFGKLNARQMDYLTQMASSGQKLLSLLKELLADSRNSAREKSLWSSRSRIRPGHLFRAAYMTIADRCDKKGIALHLDIDPDLPAISADFVKSQQVVMNLLECVVERSDAGGRVRIAVARENDFQVRCRISTAGIATDTLVKRSPESSVAFSGEADSDYVFGDGLSALRSQIRVFGGELGVEGLADSGTVFWFTLGMCENRAEGKENALAGNQTEQQSAVAGRRRILVAEDNEANLLMISALLRTRGYEAEIARNGKEAFEKAQESKPDLILMDIRMPVMDGLEATRRLRALPEFANSPIVAVTAGVDPWSWEQLLDAGCNERLAKPIVSSELFSLLRRYVGEGKAGFAPRLLNSPGAGAGFPSISCLQMQSETK